MVNAACQDGSAAARKVPQNLRAGFIEMVHSAYAAAVTSHGYSWWAPGRDEGWNADFTEFCMVPQIAEKGKDTLYLPDGQAVKFRREMNNYFTNRLIGIKCADTTGHCLFFTLA